MIDQLISTVWYLFLGCVGLVAFFVLCGLLAKPSGRRPDETPIPFPPSLEQQAVPVDGSRSWATLEVTGRETFFPRVTSHENAVYEVTLSETVYTWDGRRADAFHTTNGEGNFRNEIDWLRVNGRRLKYCSWERIESESDLCDHRYVIRIAHAGPRLALSIDRWASRHSWHGALRANVTVLPEGTLTSRERWEIEERRAEEERKRQKARAEAAAEGAEFARIVKELTIRASTERNWADPVFQDNFARAHTQDLLKQQREIRDEARAFLEQERLVAYLRRHDPTVVESILGRFHALLAAERRALDRAIAALDAPRPQLAEPPKPKPKLSAEQVKEMKVRRQQIALGDKVALAMDRVATIETVKAHVREQYGHLDEDEQQRIIQEICDEIGEEQNENGKTL